MYIKDFRYLIDFVLETFISDTDDLLQCVLLEHAAHWKLQAGI